MGLLVLWFYFITGLSDVFGLAKGAAISYNRFWRNMRTYFYNMKLTELEMQTHLRFQSGGVESHGLWRLEVIMGAEKGDQVLPIPRASLAPGCSPL